MARVRHSFEIDLRPDAAQDLFLRDILPSIQRGSAFRLSREDAGRLVLTDGLVDVDRVFDARRAAGAGPSSSRRGDGDGDGGSGSPRRPRGGGGVLAPNVERRQPWLYAALRRLSSRRLTVEFSAEEGRTRVRIAGSAERRLRDALQRLGGPGEWPPRGSAGEPG